MSQARPTHFYFSVSVLSWPHPPACCVHSRWCTWRPPFHMSCCLCFWCAVSPCLEQARGSSTTLSRTTPAWLTHRYKIHSLRHTHTQTHTQDLFRRCNIKSSLLVKFFQLFFQAGGPTCRMRRGIVTSAVQYSGLLMWSWNVCWSVRILWKFCPIQG